MENHKYADIEDILDLTDSDESTSTSNSGIFESNPITLDLHNIDRNSPTPPHHLVSRVKKYKRKIRSKSAGRKNDAESLSNDSNATKAQSLSIEKQSKEEFYDARESYHGMTEHRAASSQPAVLQAVLEDVSKTAPVPQNEQISLVLSFYPCHRWWSYREGCVATGQGHESICEHIYELEPRANPFQSLKIDRPVITQASNSDPLDAWARLLSEIIDRFLAVDESTADNLAMQDPGFSGVFHFLNQGRFCQPG
ncbi:hypothetical protein ACJJTC_004165 [Scirpophaga incertulas]